MYERWTTSPGFLAILDLCYFMNSTSVRSEESKQEIVNTIKAKCGPVKEMKAILIDFSVKKVETISAEFVAGLIDGGA